MPLMGSFYVGVSGLQTSQNSLNTTAHNISNTDTTGYVRQQILTGTAIYNTIKTDFKAVSNQQIGLGVVYTRTRQVRDVFLDATFRRESGREAFYEISSDALSEVEFLLDEMNGETFQESMDNLWNSIQELSKDPSSAVTQGLFVERCAEFLSRAQSVYEGIASYQDSLNEQVNANVKRINEIAESIKELNDDIRTIECGRVETANDLRDTRNALVDELASLANITYSEDADSTIWIQLEGEDLVRREVTFPIATHLDPKTGFYTPFWLRNAKFTLDETGRRIYSNEEVEKAKVFDLERTISSELNTDIGSLKSILLARGDHRANYTDLFPENYSSEVSQSICMNIQAEFDQLIHNIATTINKTLMDAAVAAKELNPTENYLLDKDGNPMQVFQKIASNPYGTPAYMDVNGKYIVDFNEEEASTPESLYSVTNMQINVELLREPTKLGFILQDNSVDYNTMDIIKRAFEAENSTLNPYVKKKSSFMDYYSDLVSQVANSGAVYKSLLESQNKTVEATEFAREEIIGVSQDEELTHMVKFQNAYNASSRYINVINEMLDHIIRTLAV